MKTLLKGGKVLNVFTDTIEDADVLIEDGRIVGVDRYNAADADVVEDISGKTVCPGFIDGHIHIESSHMVPAEFARAAVPHGTSAVVADPHEIVNVAGVSGMLFMLDASRDLPMTVFYTVPSCVPATPQEENGSDFTADEIRPFYSHPRVLGLAEVMNFPGVLGGDPEVLRKISDARAAGKIINGHAPMLSGKDLDRYISKGIQDDHECTSADEAKEHIRKGQWLMIRQGTAARNLKALMPLFQPPYDRRCLLVTDDKHPCDLLSNGHIDHIIRQAVAMGASPVTAVRMATLQAAQCFGLRDMGAVAPGYKANVLVLDDLESVAVRDVYFEGRKVVDGGKIVEFKNPYIRPDLWKAVRNSFYLDPLKTEDFRIVPEGDRCRVMKIVPNELITNEAILDVDFSRNNGVDIDRDILKIAVIERHMNSGHRGLGFVTGLGLKKGALASSMGHDSHNLIIVGTNDTDMCVAGDRVREIGGGYVIAVDGKVVAEMPMPIAGVIGKKTAQEMADDNAKVRHLAHELGVYRHIMPFMTMSFLSLPVIPSLKMTTKGLIDVDTQRIVPLFVKN